MAEPKPQLPSHLQLHRQLHRQLIDAVAARLRRRARLRLLLLGGLGALAGLELGWLASLWVAPAWGAAGPALAALALTLAGARALRTPSPRALTAAALIDARRGGALLESTLAARSGRLAGALARAADRAAAELDPRSLVALRAPPGFALALAGLAFLGLLLAGAEPRTARPVARRRSPLISLLDGRGVGLAGPGEEAPAGAEVLEVVIEELPTGIEGPEASPAPDPDPAAPRLIPPSGQAPLAPKPDEARADKPADLKEPLDEGDGGDEGEGGEGGEGSGPASGEPDGDGRGGEDGRAERDGARAPSQARPEINQTGGAVGAAARRSALSWRARRTLKSYRQRIAGPRPRRFQ